MRTGIAQRLRRSALAFLLLASISAAIGLATMGVADETKPNATTARDPKNGAGATQKPKPQGEKGAAKQAKAKQTNEVALEYRLVKDVGRFLVEMKWPLALSLLVSLVHNGFRSSPQE